ncbi:MAG: hypothetical protein ACYTF6_08420 [Planctomycetota bacterium]
MRSKRLNGNRADPRPLAAAIDSYLLTEPDVQEEQERPVEKLSISLQAGAGAESPVGDEPKSILAGTDYRLVITPSARIFPPAASSSRPATNVAEKAPAQAADGDAGTPGPLELQVRSPGADVRKDANGGYVIRFRASGDHVVACYYLDAKGDVVAHGRMQVSVMDRPETDKDPQE